MKSKIVLRSKTRSLSVRKLLYILPALILGVLLTLGSVSSAFAAVTFSGIIGPTFIDPGYEFRVSISLLSNPEKYISLLYNVNSGTNSCVNCACTAPGCNPANGTGTWVCTIPTTHLSSTITWDISAYPNDACGGNKTLLRSSTFTTDPTAVEMLSMSTRAERSDVSQIELIMVAAFGSAVLFLMLMWKNKRPRLQNSQ